MLFVAAAMVPIAYLPLRSRHIKVRALRRGAAHEGVPARSVCPSKLCMHTHNAGGARGLPRL